MLEEWRVEEEKGLQRRHGEMWSKCPTTGKVMLGPSQDASVLFHEHNELREVDNDTGLYISKGIGSRLFL